MVDKVCDIRSRQLIHHIVMFINVKNVRWRCQEAAAYELAPTRESLVMFFHNKIYRGTAPFE